MGASASSPLPDLPFANKYMCVAFGNYCQLYLLYPGREEIKVVRDAVNQYWCAGIEEEKVILTELGQFPKCYQIILVGAPFKKGSERGETSSMRLMTTKMLQSLCRLGWKLLVSTDLSRSYDQTTWIFQRTNLSEAPPRFFNIGLSSSGTLQINNGTEELVKVIRHSVNRTLIGSIQKEEQINRTCFEISLYGSPWNASGKDESSRARLLLKDIIQTLAQRNMMLYGNSNLKNTADTLFFQYSAVSTGTDEKFIMLSLHGSQCIRLIPAPDQLCTVVQGILQRSSCELRKAVRLSEFCFEFKFCDILWNTKGIETIFGRMLLLYIMKKLGSKGYLIHTGIGLSRIHSDKDVLLFRKLPPLDTDFFCLAPKKMNTLLFIQTPRTILQAARQVIQQSSFSVHNEGRENADVYFVEFDGSPWQSIRHGHGIHGRVILLWLIHVFSTLGWRLVCSMDATSRTDRQNSTDKLSDVHSLYFMYDETLLTGNTTPPSSPKFDTTGTYNRATAPSESTTEEPPSYDSVRDTDEKPPPSYEEVTQNINAATGVSF